MCSIVFPFDWIFALVYFSYSNTGFNLYWENDLGSWKSIEKKVYFVFYVFLKEFSGVTWILKSR